MGASAVPIVLLTLFWLVVGAVIPWFIPKGPNRGMDCLGHLSCNSLPKSRVVPPSKCCKEVIQTMLITTAVCCYLFWLCAYMAQMNPLQGPQLKTSVLAVMQKEWSG